MSLIGISGKIGSGKDTVAAAIQYLTQEPPISSMSFEEWYSFYKHGASKYTTWEVKKFAEKLKQIVSILINCSPIDLDNQNFKILTMTDLYNMGIISKEYFNSLPE